MSLAIQSNNIVRVLLADGWHDVKKRSFDIDAFEVMEGGLCIHKGGQSDICASGFRFLSEEGMWIAGPLTSVLAVEHDEW